MPLELIERIEEKSDGVPLYAEEFTKMVLESDLLVKSNGHYELVRAVTNLAIPSSLQDSLLARLDRLRDGKVVAQWGATIGREFSYELIKALLPDEIADNGLKELLELGIIYKRKRTLQTIFIFKHALIQDAAYASLLRAELTSKHWPTTSAVWSCSVTFPRGARMTRSNCRSRWPAGRCSCRSGVTDPNRYISLSPARSS